MDVQGLSIFQGGNSIQVNTSANQLEEQEALEDQRRRNEELGYELQNAFDDLIDDEDCTIDTNSNFKSNYDPNQSKCNEKNSNSADGNNCENSTLQVKDNKQYNYGDFKSSVNIYIEENEHLKKIIESKNNEIENIKKILYEERKKSDEINKRLSISEAEKCRALMSKQQTHELLVESKAKYSELEDSTLKLKTKIKTLEESNTKLQEELERTRLLLSDVQQKYHMVEKNAGFNADRQTDVLLKQANDRHNAQLEILQQQLDNLRNKLDEKDRELNTFDIRYKELQRNREAMLINKSETINQLAKSLEESQQQCQKLMTKMDFAQENIALKKVINALEQQSDQQQKVINDLRHQLDTTTSELALISSALNENVDSDINSSKRIHFTKCNLLESTPLTSNDKLERLKQELYRSISSQRSKREEIKKLQTELESKDLELKKMHSELENKFKEFEDLKDELNIKNNNMKYLKEEENKCLVIINTQREEKIRLENRIKVLENELDEAINKNVNNSKLKLLETENKTLVSEKQKLNDEIEKIRNDSKLFGISSPKSNENKLYSLDIQLKNLNIDLEELKQEHESLKNNYETILNENKELKECKQLNEMHLELEKQKFLLKDAQNECNRIKNLYIEVSNTKEQISIELEQLKLKDYHKELQEEKEKCASLQRSLQLAEMKSLEVMKLLEIEKSNRENEVKRLKEKSVKEKIGRVKNNCSLLNCTKCLNYTAEITKLEIANIKLENQCAIYRKQLNELHEQLSQSQEIISELNDKLGLKEDQDKIIANLKEKAQQFENYIETCRSTNTYNNTQQVGSNSTSGISSPKASTTRNHSVDSSSEYQSKLRIEIETSIRDEMAKIFAKELKAMEECFRIRLKEIEDENILLKNNLQKINNDLILRQNEVELLKYTVMTERGKFDEISKLRDSQNEKTIQKYTNILHKCREELKSKQDRVKELIKELEERNTQIENERYSMKAVMKQWEESRTLSEKKETELLKCIDEIKNEHSKIIESWKAKYESAKKTANNYKIYSEEKEQHFIKEYERMKTEFEVARTKLKNKFHDCLERKSTSKNVS